MFSNKYPYSILLREMFCPLKICHKQSESQKKYRRQIKSIFESMNVLEILNSINDLKHSVYLISSELPRLQFQEHDSKNEINYKKLLKISTRFGEN